MKCGRIDLLALIARLYDGVDHDDYWPRVAAELSNRFYGAVVLITQPPAACGLAAAGVGPEFACSYAERYATEDPWVPASANCSDGTLCSGRVLLSPAELVETDFYKEWMQPQRLAPRSAMVGTLAHAAGQPLSALRMFWRMGAHPLTAEDFAAARLVTQHLSRVCAVRQEVMQLRGERDSIAAALDTVLEPVLLANAQGEIVGFNASAQAFVSPAGGVRCKGCDSYGCQRTASLLLREAFTAVTAGTCASHVVTIPCPLGQPGCTLTATRLPYRTAATQSRPVAAVMIHTHDVRLPASAALASLFGLTPAETRLAQHLAMGESLTDAAATLGRAVNTVRAQLIQIFQKTGTSRQAELVRLLLSGVQPTRCGCNSPRQCRPSAAA